MTTGIYAGISPTDLGYEPDLPVATCPKCDGAVSNARRGRGLICSVCLMEYDSMSDLTEATAYYEGLLWDEYDQRAEDEHAYADTVGEGLERWQR